MVSVFCCNPWESHVEQLVEENERERLQHELEEDLERELELHPDEEIALEQLDLDVVSWARLDDGLTEDDYEVACD